MQHFASILEVPVGSLQMLMVATVAEVLGDWQAEWSSSCPSSSSPNTTTTAIAVETSNAGVGEVVAQHNPQESSSSSHVSSTTASSSPSHLRVIAAKLEMWMCAMFEDMSTASDLYFTESMVHCLWMAVQQHPAISCRRVEMLTGCPRTSVESIVIALTLQTFLATRRSSALFSGMTMDELLGVDVFVETHGGGLVEYVEGLLEGGVS